VTSGSERQSKTRGSLTLEKGIRILDCFDSEHAEWTLGDICAHTKITKQTAYRLLRTLVEVKYLDQHPSTYVYHAGPGLVKLAYLTLSEDNLSRIARPRLEELAAETTETAVLDVWIGQGAVHADKVLTSRPFKPSILIGSVLPGLASASSKLFVAFGTDDMRRVVLETGFERFTGHTIVDAAEMEEVLEQVRREGTAFSLEEWYEGMCAVAAPIMGPGGQIVATVAVVAPSERFGPAQMRTYSASVRQAASRISASLGETEASPEQ
jgi:DNA-binding IclR family transcriptional regulator